ncbi:seipin-2 [Senna tora]|uniref:Seipin-2 n=1 Tax=Senna tora TaxID=362788 RepID=A0A834X950_9FABA|nr:seipin-2 [Senna tora]
MGERIVPARHKVQVTVSLLVPESEYNRNLGIFQVRVDFLSTNGKTIARFSQPYMLRFRSEPIRLALTFLKLAPVITGYISETQTLNVKMRGFIEKENVPTSCLRVTLEQRAEYRSGAGIPEVYDAYLVLESELPFLKRIIWQWKMSIFVWITMVAFIFEVIFVLLCCRPIILPRIRRRGASVNSATTQNNLQAPS